MKNLLSNFNLNGKKIGNNKETYIIFEAGPTHNGLDTAKKLVDKAKIAGADAIKFQILERNIILNTDQKFKYKYLLSKKKNIIKSTSEPLSRILKRREMNLTDWSKLSKYCKKKKITFFATVSNNSHVDFLKKIGCETLKIASADINHYPLIDYAARSGMIIQIDTGMADLDEIDETVKLIKKNSNKIIIHHCPSGYPSKTEDVNLNIIKTLKNKYTWPIAYSDHSTGYDMNIAAVSLGADILEKTITLDKSIKGPEHMMSLEPDEMINFVKTIKLLDLAMGNYEKKFTLRKKLERRLFRRSVLVTQDVKKNKKLKDIDVKFKKPEIGITPSFYFFNKNKLLSKNLKRNSIIKLRHVKKK